MCSGDDYVVSCHGLLHANMLLRVLSDSRFCTRCRDVMLGRSQLIRLDSMLHILLFGSYPTYRAANITASIDGQQLLLNSINTNEPLPDRQIPVRFQAGYQRNNNVRSNNPRSAQWAFLTSGHDQFRAVYNQQSVGIPS
jgi:hypothetical protein